MHPMIRHVANGLGALAVTLAVTSSSAAAGQYCGERIEGGAALRPTEDTARKDAESWWESRAGSLGKGFQNWAIAQDKKVDCSKKIDGSVRCVASGKPCLPEGTLPSDIPKIEM